MRAFHDEKELIKTNVSSKNDKKSFFKSFQTTITENSEESSSIRNSFILDLHLSLVSYHKSTTYYKAGPGVRSCVHLHN